MNKHSASPAAQVFRPAPHALVFFIVTLLVQSAIAAATDTEAPRPQSPRELYNAGTAKLREGQFEEAQDLLRAAAQGNNDFVVPSAVYNLGHARYELGDRELNRTLASPQLREIPQRASRSAQAALQSARSALASGDVDELVQAYRRGAGARKELREAARAVERAMAQFQIVLINWQHASASFHSVSELDPGDTNASFNADIVDRRIAELIDFLKMQKLAAAGRGNTGQELKGAMSQIRDRLPADKRGQLPGDSEEEEEDGDTDGNSESDSGPKGRKGKTPITQEQAAKMLRGVQLDSQRTLPVNNPKAAKPAKRNGGDW